MPFDAVFLTAVARELRDSCLGSRIDRVHQPARDLLILQLRGRDGPKKLLISASAGSPRIHFTGESTENPAQPPMFCMLLRKHLVGGKLVEIRQPKLERMLDFIFECTDELGEPCQKHLVAEIMGRSSNLILLDGESRILDCLRRVDFEMSEKRQVLPGLYYHEPPKQDRLDPTTLDAAALLPLLEAVQTPKRLDAWLLDTFSGIPPLIARELSFEFCADVACDMSALSAAERQRLANLLAARFVQLETGPFSPVLLYQDEMPKDFSYRAIAQYGDFCRTEIQPSFCGLLDRFYGARDRAERAKQKTATLHKTVQNLLHRTARKLEIQKKELEATYDRERLRQLGDILTANLSVITRGQPRLKATDFYDPDMKEIEIPLSVQLSPQQNAAKYYKEYTKAKNAEKMLTGLIEKGEQEHEYLASILDELSRSETEKDIAEIRAELVDGGYVRETSGKKKMKQTPTRPMEFRSTAGLTIYVGRNNRQNDMLTLKAASRTDLWLHTQKIHGSHVIIACGGQEPDDETVTEAAMLAAFYSQARGGQNVPVDATAVRNVKKPAGSKPGMVIYDHYRTVYVTPDPELAERLRVGG